MANSPAPMPSPETTDNSENDSMSMEDSGSSHDEKDNDFESMFSSGTDKKDKKTPEEELIEILQNMFTSSDTETEPSDAMNGEKNQYNKMAKSNNEEGKSAGLEEAAEAEEGASLAALAM